MTMEFAQDEERLCLCRSGAMLSGRGGTKKDTPKLCDARLPSP